MTFQPIMKVLITGATGFLGRELCKRLNQRKDLDVIVLTRRENFPKCLKEKATVIKGDIRFSGLGLSQDDERKLEGVEVVYHSAANTSFNII